MRLSTNASPIGNWMSAVLTLGELKTIADRFRFTLSSMLHSRIAYPKSGQKTAISRDESLRPDVMVATRKPETAPPVSAA